MTLGRRAQKYMVCTSRRLDFEIRLVTPSEIGTVVRTQEDMMLHKGLQLTSHLEEGRYSREKVVE